MKDRSTGMTGTRNSGLLASLTAVVLLMFGTMRAEMLVPGQLEHDAITEPMKGIRSEPTGFEENKGQVHTTSGEAATFVRFHLREGNTNIFLLNNGIAYQFNRTQYPEGFAELEKDDQRGATKQQELDALCKQIRLETYRMDMLLEGANTDAHITAEGRSEDYTQYYGQNALDVHTYSRVTYHEVYPGIDWVVYTTKGGMKYDFVLRPGADPTLIQLRFKDHEELRVDADGRLIHGNRMGRFTEDRPVSFQNGKEVGTRFVLKGDRLSFALDAFDHSQPLTIDPDRLWATYYGIGASPYMTYSCTTDENNNAYLAGSTSSTTGIASGGYQNTLVGLRALFLVKFNADGVRQWGTYYEGSCAGTSPGSCAVDGEGNVYLAGITSCTEGIAFGGHQNTLAVGSETLDIDLFLVKFNASGVRQWATYYGGIEVEDGGSCAVDGDGNVYLAGVTFSNESIAMGGHQNSLGGLDYNADAFLVKFNTDGVRQWATYYGGEYGEEEGYCTVDGDGNVFLTGTTHSTDGIAFGGYQNTNMSGSGGFNSDAFLVKFNTNGVRQWGTYYGGTARETGKSCATDLNGNVYLAGSASNSTSTTTGGHQSTAGGEMDLFLVKFNTNGVLQWDTFYGGPEHDEGPSCAVDGSGNVYLAGMTVSTDAIAANGYQNTFAGIRDAFLVKFDTDGVRLWGTYFGGTNDDRSNSCAVDGSGNVYMAGLTYSSEGIASGGHQNTFEGSTLNGYLVKFDGAPSIGTTIREPQDLERTISIWPNPNFDGRLFLQMEGNGAALVQLYDALGKLQQTEQIRSISDNVPLEIMLDDGLAKGIYVVRCTVNGRTYDAPLLIP